MEYQFSPSEQAQFAIWAHQRQGPKTLYAVPNNRVDKTKTDMEVHDRGVRGDYVAGPLMHDVPMHQLNTIGGDGGGVDYTIGEITLSAKAAQVKARHVLVPPTQWPPRADFILQFIDLAPDRMRFAGVISSEHFRWYVGVHNKRDLGQGFSYCFPMELLVPPAIYLDHIRPALKRSWGLARLRYAAAAQEHPPLREWIAFAHQWVSE